MPSGPSGQARLRAALAALVGTCCLSAGLRGQTHRAAEPAKKDNVTATVQGLENLRLMEKGIVTDQSASDLSTSRLLNNASLDQKAAAAEAILPIVPQNGSEDAAQTLEELRREQWEKDNWLVDGMRRSELAADEAALAEEIMGTEVDATEPDSSLPDSGSAEHWLALAVDMQSKDDSNRRDNAAVNEPSGGKQSVVRENPLGDFMAGWLSSDSRRLMADEASAQAANAEKTLLAQLGAKAADRAVVEADGLAAFLSANPGAHRTSTRRVGDPRETANPFLADWQDFSLGGTGGGEREPAFTVPGLNDPGPASANTLQPMATEIQLGNQPPAATLSNPADSEEKKPASAWQPPARDDEKYFPRLNRF